jgi:hypothetical protein
MKTLNKFALCCALIAAPFTGALGTQWTTSGYVFCDANQNGQIDSGDKPLPGVLVVITNFDGTYSNADFTGTPDGGFIIQLPGPGTYTEYLHPATLPADATSVIPPTGTYSYTFTVGVISNFEGNFLISSASCATNTPPPPPPPPPQNTNCCEMNACATIMNHSCISYIIGGNAKSGGTNADSGKWDVLDVKNRLHLEAIVTDVIVCGTYTNGTCVYHYMDFSGSGTLKGVSGCRANYGSVTFIARVEDGGSCRGCADRIYVRVLDATNNTVLLVNGDTNPDNVMPVNVAGDVTVKEVPCTTCGGGSTGGNPGGGGSGGGDKGGGCDNGGKGGQGGGGDKGGGKGGDNGGCDNGGNKGGGKGGGGDDKGGGKGGSGDCDNGGNKGGGNGGDKGGGKGSGGDCDKGGDKGGGKGGNDSGGKGGDKGGDKGGGKGSGGNCDTGGSKGGDSGKGGSKGGKGKG